MNDTLVNPQAPHPMPRLAQEILSFQDKISIAWALNWLIDEICGVNPFGKAAEWFGGDFEKFTRAADALVHLSEFFSAYAHTVDDAQWDLSKGWSGEAADAAQTYFATVTTALKDLRPQSHDAGKALEEVAVTVYYLGQSVQGGLQLLADLAIAAGISAAAAAATSWTVVGGVAGAAATALFAAEAVLTWTKILNYHSTAVAAVEAVAGLLGGYANSIEEITSALPDPYRGVASS